VNRRGERAFRELVRRSDDRRLERVAGSNAGLRILFTGMAQRYVPERAGGFEGTIQYRLRASDGRSRLWMVQVDAQRARVNAGKAPNPAVTLELSVVDFLRIAARELDPPKAMMTGRLNVEGDFAVLSRMAEMFGQPSSY
jgi:putative sterol carrier protein